MSTKLLKKQKITMTAAEMKANNVLMTVNDSNRWLEPPLDKIATVFFVKYRDSKRKVYTRMRNDILLRLRVYMESANTFKKVKSKLAANAEEYIRNVDKGLEPALHVAPEFEQWILQQQWMLSSRFGAGSVTTDVAGVATSSAGSESLNASMALMVDYLGNIASALRRLVDHFAPEPYARKPSNTNGALILGQLSKASKTKLVEDDTESSTSEDENDSSEDDVKITSVTKSAMSSVVTTSSTATASSSSSTSATPTPVSAPVPSSAAPLVTLPAVLATSAPVTSTSAVVLNDNSNLNNNNSLAEEIDQKKKGKGKKGKEKEQKEEILKEQKQGHDEKDDKDDAVASGKKRKRVSARPKGRK